MVRIRITVSGDALEDVRRAPDKVRQAVRTWVSEGSQLVRTAMVTYIRDHQNPVGRTGFLSNSVRADKAAAGFAVYPTVKYARFVDQPTRPHIIRPRKPGGFLAFARAGGQISRSQSGAVRTKFRFGGKTTFAGAVFARQVHHPGTKGMFFIDRTAAKVERPVTELLDKKVAEALR